MNAQSKIAAPQVYAAINAVMAGLAKEGITKSRVNTQGQGFRFRGIDDVLNALSGLLVEHKLVMLPRVLSRDGEVRQSSKGSPIFVAFCEVEYDLVSVEDGSSHVIRTIGEAMDMSDKASNKAMSAAYKYAAIQAFCIPTEGDNDADAHTHEVAAAEKVPGIHKIKERLRTLQADGNQATDLEAFNAHVSEYADDLGKIKEARHSWWTGDGEDFEGFKAWILRRRDELAPKAEGAPPLTIAERMAAIAQQDDGQFKMLIDSMKACDTRPSLENWRIANEAMIEALDGAESRQFQAEYDAHEAGIKLLDTATT